MAVLRRWRHGRQEESLRDAWRAPAVLSWAGARGVVPLAAALAIPLTDTAGAPLPFRDLVQVIASAVIVISLVVQGFTPAPLVRMTGVAVAASDEKAELASRLRLAEAGVDYVETQADMEAVAPVVAEGVRRSLRARVELAHEASGAADEVEADYRRLRRTVVHAQRAELERLHGAGTASEATRRHVQRQLDVEDARYREESRP
ncbi:hypothetical protein [Micromonospora sp. WMMD1274]|uniref:hypothetical protein n=1 Tax=Micromonospora sp. WMMD1274 TaxID=3404116 RepID=UPI003B923910